MRLATQWRGNVSIQSLRKRLNAIQRHSDPERVVDALGMLCHGEVAPDSGAGNDARALWSQSERHGSSDVSIRYLWSLTKARRIGLSTFFGTMSIPNPQRSEG